MFLYLALLALLQPFNAGNDKPCLDGALFDDFLDQAFKIGTCFK
jgi:hypothetical protein